MGIVSRPSSYDTILCEILFRSPLALPVGKARKKGLRGGAQSLNRPAAENMSNEYEEMLIEVNRLNMSDKNVG